DACPLVTARAGNVVGGGDWSPFRIVHDVVEAAAAGRAVALRYPRARFARRLSDAGACDGSGAELGSGGAQFRARSASWSGLSLPTGVDSRPGVRTSANIRAKRRCSRSMRPERGGSSAGGRCFRWMTPYGGLPTGTGHSGTGRTSAL